MLKKICEFLTGVIITCLVIFAVILTVPRLLGFQSLAVLSGSMEPEIGVGAIVFAKKTEPTTIKIGDVITYRISDTTMVTHRVETLDVDSEQLYTKGDANDTRDAAPVEFENIVGRVAFHVPLIGYLTIYAKTPLGIAAICGVLVILILLTFLPEVFTADIKNENKDASTVIQKK